jgi:hypothetical protein
MFPVVLMLLLISFRAQNAYALFWQLGWTTTASVNDIGAGSEAEVEGGLNCSGCTFEATTGFYEKNGTWLAVIIEDTSDGSTVFGNWEWRMYSTSSCSGSTDNLGGINYCDNSYSGCGTWSTSTYYTQKIYYDSSTSKWIYTNSNCSGSGSYPDSSSYGEIEQADSYLGSADILETNTNGNFFASDAAADSFDSSLEYETSSGTWYTASNTYIASYDNSAPSTSVGADFNCSTPWLFIDSGWGGPWQTGSYTSPTWVCT